MNFLKTQFHKYSKGVFPQNFKFHKKLAPDTEHLFYQFFVDDEIRSSSLDETGIIIIVYNKRGIKM